MPIIELFLVRHAVAAEKGPVYADDRLRPLTPDGIARFRQAVKGLRALGISLDLIATSPLLRTRQTAELLAAGLTRRPPIEELASLAPGSRPAGVLDALPQLAKRGTRLALVGHQPDLGDLGAKLLGARGAFDFKKGAVALIEVDQATPSGPGTLQWMLPPRVLRRLGR